MKIDQEKEVQNLKQEVQIEQDRVGTLKSKYFAMASQKESTHDELLTLRKAHDNIKTVYEQRLSALQKEKLQTEAKFAESEQETRKQLMEMRNDNMRQEMELRICRSEKEELKNQLQRSQRKNSCANHDLLQ